jgi:hypothetical protein
MSETHVKDPAAVALGRRGGAKGGLARVPKGFASPAVQAKAQASLRKKRKKKE